MMEVSSRTIEILLGAGSLKMYANPIKFFSLSIFVSQLGAESKYGKEFSNIFFSLICPIFEKETLR